MSLLCRFVCQYTLTQVVNNAFLCKSRICSALTIFLGGEGAIVRSIIDKKAQASAIVPFECTILYSANQTRCCLGTWHSAIQFPIAHCGWAWPKAWSCLMYQWHIGTDRYRYCSWSIVNSGVTIRKPRWYQDMTSSHMSCKYGFPPWLGSFLSSTMEPRGLRSWGCSCSILTWQGTAVGKDGSRCMRHETGNRQRQRAAGNNVDGGRQQQQTMMAGEEDGACGQWEGSRVTLGCNGGWRQQLMVADKTKGWWILMTAAEGGIFCSSSSGLETS